MEWPVINFSLINVGKNNFKTPTRSQASQKEKFQSKKSKLRRELCEDGIIPKAHHSFYQNLQTDAMKKDFIDGSDLEKEAF